MASGVRITGLGDTVRKLERLGVSTDDLKQAFGQIAEEVARDAGRIVPVQTGALAGTIRPARTKNKAVVRAGTGARVPYAGVINYGWPAHGITPTEFLTRPANSDLPQKSAAIERNLAALIRKYDL